MVRLSWKSVICLAALAVFAGCPAAGTGVATVPVSGTVTLDGTPVEGANVAFAPKSADGRAAAGVTDASGRFTLTTVQSGDGALPGSYAVTVSKMSGGPAITRPEDPSKMSPEEGKAFMEQVQQLGKTSSVTDLLPAKYKSAADSGLTAEVTKGGENDFTFPLTSQ